MVGSVIATHHPTRFGSHKQCGIGDVLKEFVFLGNGKKDAVSVIIATVAKIIK